MGVGGNDWTSVLTAVRSVVPEGDHPVARAVRSARRQAVRADLDGSANLTTIEINPGYNWTGAFYYTDNVPVWDSGQYGEFPMNQA